MQYRKVGSLDSRIVAHTESTFRVRRHAGTTVKNKSADRIHDLLTNSQVTCDTYILRRNTGYRLTSGYFQGNPFGENSPTAGKLAARPFLCHNYGR